MSYFYCLLKLWGKRKLILMVRGKQQSVQDRLIQGNCNLVKIFRQRNSAAGAKCFVRLNFPCTTVLFKKQIFSCK